MVCFQCQLSRMKLWFLNTYTEWQWLRGFSYLMLTEQLYENIICYNTIYGLTERWEKRINRNYIIIYEPKKVIILLPIQISPPQWMPRHTQRGWNLETFSVSASFYSHYDQPCMRFCSSGYEDTFIHSSPTSCPGLDAYKRDKGVTSLARLIKFSNYQSKP